MSFSKEKHSKTQRARYIFFSPDPESLLNSFFRDWPRSSDDTDDNDETVTDHGTMSTSHVTLLKIPKHQNRLFFGDLLF